MRDVAVIVAVLLSVLVGSGSAQTTRPAPAGFSGAVEDVSEGLVSGDVSALNKLLDESATFGGFDADARHTAEQLIVATTGGAVVSLHAYGQLPANLASDLATDFSKADHLPEAIRKEMMPDPANVVKANVTATQWIMQTLDPNRKQLIGVIVVWPREHKAAANLRPDLVRPIFVLLKGEIADGKVRVKQIVFGDPLDAK
jgi:hypothetical protein